MSRSRLIGSRAEKHDTKSLLVLIECRKGDMAAKNMRRLHKPTFPTVPNFHWQLSELLSGWVSILGANT